MLRGFTVDLFDWTEPDTPSTDPPRTPSGRRLARKDGPETSRLAAEAIAGSVGELQRWAVRCVTESPGLTARELAQRYCPSDPRRIGRRLGEAAVAGLLRRGPARVCMVSGHKADTGHLPGA